MKQITLFFAVQVLRRKSGVNTLKVPQGDNEWNSKRRKGTKGKNPRKMYMSVKYIILNISLGKVCIK